MKQFISRVVGSKRVLFVIGMGIFFGAPLSAAAATRAPIQCAACTFGGAPSEQVLSAIRDSQANSGYVDSVGDVYIVCNGTLCGQYVVSSDFRYNLMKVVRQGGMPGGPIGGNPGIPGSGGIPPGGGGGGGGTVIIGPVCPHHNPKCN